VVFCSFSGCSFLLDVFGIFSYLQVEGRNADLNMNGINEGEMKVKLEPRIHCRRLWALN